MKNKTSEKLKTPAICYRLHRFIRANRQEHPMFFALFLISSPIDLSEPNCFNEFTVCKNGKEVGESGGGGGYKRKEAFCSNTDLKQS